MNKSVFFLAIGAFLVFGVGCESESSRNKITDETTLSELEDQKKQITKEIQELAAGKDLSTAKDSKAFDDAKAKLIARGSKIETTLIDNLRRSDDWGIRVGIIEVLMATGTKVSIDHLIVCLDDSEPLVAFRANSLLVEMTQHSEIPVAEVAVAEIPAAGQPPTSGIESVPKPPAQDLSLDVEQRTWATWQQKNGKALRAAWASWWAANKGTAEIK